MNEKLLKKKITKKALMDYVLALYPKLNPGDYFLEKILICLEKSGFKKIWDVHKKYLQAKTFLLLYHSEKPGYFNCGSDYLSKALGFADHDFRYNYGHYLGKNYFGYSIIRLIWDRNTLEAFDRLADKKEKE